MPRLRRTKGLAGARKAGGLHMLSDDVMTSQRRDLEDKSHDDRGWRKLPPGKTYALQ